MRNGQVLRSAETTLACPPTWVVTGKNLRPSHSVRTVHPCHPSNHRTPACTSTLLAHDRPMPCPTQRTNAIGEQCRWESQQCTASLPIHPPPTMRILQSLTGPLHTSGETQTLEEGSLRIECYTSQWYVRAGSWQRHPAVLRVRSPPPHTRQGSLPVLHILSTHCGCYPWLTTAAGWGAGSAQRAGPAGGPPLEPALAALPPPCAETPPSPP